VEEAVPQVRPSIDATIVAALAGAAIGLIFGLALGFVTPLFDPCVLSADSQLWESVLRSALIWLLIGGVYGSIFGILIGRGLSEEDTSITRHIPPREVMVVSVNTADQDRADAVDILRVRHERQLERMPA